MITISLKLPVHHAERLKTLAKERRTSKSALIRQAVEQFINNPGAGKEESFLQSISDLVGTVHGPRDLSTNPKYLMEALREDHHRCRPPNRTRQRG